MKKTQYIYSILLALIMCLCIHSGNSFAQEQSTSSTPFQHLVDQADALVSEGKLIEARTLLEDILTEVNTDALLGREVRKRLGSLNIRILFSRTKTADSLFYTIKPGDNLYTIAKDHQTTIELIKKANSVSGSTIYPDETLKIVKGTFKIFVNKSKNTLVVKLGDRFFKEYVVATGKDGCTPQGTFSIRDKLPNPTWYHAGAVVPPDSPKNILGTRWMGFDLRGYGIHGTTLPETVGSQSTAGCIRMFNTDVEELYAYIPVGTTVVVVE